MRLVKFFKRALGNPATPISDPANWLVDLFGGGGTSSGVNVDEKTALQFSAVWACVRILSESMAMLPLDLMQSDGKTKSKARDHRLYRMMHDSPNSNMTSFIFRETVQGHASSWGNGYAHINRDNAARPVDLTPLMPDVTDSVIVNGRHFYKTLSNSQNIEIDPSNILHIPGIGFDGIKGYSPLFMHRESIGLGLAAEKFGSKFFSNGAVVNGVLENPGKLRDADVISRLKKQWNDAYSGLDNSHKTVVLEDGMKYTRIGIPPEDAQMLETRKFQITDIARIFRIPPHMLADLEKATFSNIEQQDLNFVKHTMVPWVVRWEQELNKKLLTDRERGKYYFKFNLDGLLRGDTAARAKFYKDLFSIGAISPNEIREKEDENPFEEGDKKYIPMNFVSVDAMPADDNQSDENNERLNKFALSQVKLIAKKERDLILKENKRRSKKEFALWMDEFITSHSIEISERLHIDVEAVKDYRKIMLGRTIEFYKDEDSEIENELKKISGI